MLFPVFICTVICVCQRPGCVFVSDIGGLFGYICFSRCVWRTVFVRFFFFEQRAACELVCGGWCVVCDGLCAMVGVW